MRMKMRIFKNPLFKGCSNYGISEYHDDAILVWDEEINEDLDLDHASTPVLKLVRRDICGRKHLHAEPIIRPRLGRVGWMAGGSFLWTSDSRRPEGMDYPISIHDRSERPSAP